MSEVFEALPGIEVPVDRIAVRLAQIWTDTAAEGRAAPVRGDAVAKQVNLVLHFGLGAWAGESLDVFRSAVRFSSRYPSRVVVLCPLHKESGALSIRSKIYAECFLGKTRGDSRCCEFVFLSYSLAARRFLENQVSVCLAPDLPLYYWAHRFTACSRLADYQYLLTGARRFVFDRAAAPDDAPTYPWPCPERVRDLAFARTLPIRQSIGQYLARFAPAQLTDRLTEVVMAFDAHYSAEGLALSDWVKDRLSACGDISNVSFATATLSSEGGGCFDLKFNYTDGRTFRWQADCRSGKSEFHSNFGSGPTSMPGHVGMLDAERALAEAMFF